MELSEPVLSVQLLIFIPTGLCHEYSDFYHVISTVIDKGNGLVVSFHSIYSHRYLVLLGARLRYSDVIDSLAIAIVQL